MTNALENIRSKLVGEMNGSPQGIAQSLFRELSLEGRTQYADKYLVELFKRGWSKEQFIKYIADTLYVKGGADEIPQSIEKACEKLRELFHAYIVDCRPINDPHASFILVLSDPEDYPAALAVVPSIWYNWTVVIRVNRPTVKLEKKIGRNKLGIGEEIRGSGA